MGKSLNLQDMFLNQVRKEGIAVAVTMVGGATLNGHVRGFDAFTVLIDAADTPTQLVYKHAISHILPEKQISSRQDRE